MGGYPINWKAVKRRKINFTRPSGPKTVEFFERSANQAMVIAGHLWIVEKPTGPVGLADRITHRSRSKNEFTFLMFAFQFESFSTMC